MKPTAANPYIKEFITKIGTKSGFENYPSFNVED